MSTPFFLETIVSISVMPVLSASAIECTAYSYAASCWTTFSRFSCRGDRVTSRPAPLSPCSSGRVVGWDSLRTSKSAFPSRRTVSPEPVDFPCTGLILRGTGFEWNSRLAVAQRTDSKAVRVTGRQGDKRFWGMGTAIRIMPLLFSPRIQAKTGFLGAGCFVGIR